MKRIVMIDDEPGAMDYYRRALRIHNYEVELLDTAEKAKAAIGTWDARPPDAVVLDLMLPPGRAFTAQETRNGLETGLCLLHLIRKKFPSLPVVILSSYHEKILEMQKIGDDSALRAVSKFEAPPFTVVQILGEITSASQSGKTTP